MSDDKQTKVEIRHSGSTIEFVEPNAISEVEVWAEDDGSFSFMCHGWRESASCTLDKNAISALISFMTEAKK